MLVGILVFAGLFSGSNACSSVGGNITATPTFSFTFYPPIAWTFSNDRAKTVPGQWDNAADARRNVKNDVNSAISTAVRKSGYEGLLSSARYSISGYNADTPFPIGNTPGDYVVELGAVTKQIAVVTTTPPPPEEKKRRKRDIGVDILAVSSTTPTTDNVQTLQLKISNSPMALTTEQWAKVASDAYRVLSVQYKVRFVSNIKVSA